MRCLGCDGQLTDFDATIKYASNGNFLDLCSRCRRHLPRDILLIERADLDTGESDAEETEHDASDNDNES